MALFSSLSDNFNDNSLNTSIWSTRVDAPLTISETTGLVRIIAPSGDNSGHVSKYISQLGYDLSGSSLQLEVVEALRSPVADTSVAIYNSATTINMMESNSQLFMFVDWAGNSASASVTYNSTNHRWWRIRAVSTTVYWDTSADGITWVNQFSQTISTSLSAMTTEIGASVYGSSPISMQMRFDNVNSGNYNRDIITNATGGGVVTLVSTTGNYAIASSASGGGVATFLTTYQSIPGKDYEYRVFDHAGNYLSTWQNITSDFNYEQSINQNASQLTVSIARAPDNLIYKFSTLLDENSAAILDNNSDPIMVQTATANAVGADTDIDLNYNVDVYAFYGGYDALLDSNGDVITDNNSDPILSQFGSPNGKRVYSGYIADYDLQIGETSGVDVVIVPFATEQQHHIFNTAGGLTTVSYNSTDPVVMARDAMVRYNAEGGVIKYTSQSMPLSGQSSSYDFKLQTTREAIDKVIDLLPSGYYQFVDPGENVQYVLQKGSVADHTFYFEKHITMLNLRKSITQLVNKVYFVGGETSPGINLYKYYEDTTSVAANRPGLDRISDSRVTLSTSAGLISQSRIADYKDPRWRTSVVISDAVYDIESIKLGQMVGFKNFGMFADSLVLQIVTINRSAHTVTLDLDMVVDSDSKRLQDIYKQIQNQEIIGVGTTPS